MIVNLIKAFHITFLIFVLFVPFFGNEFLLTYHFITIPFVVLHWLTNNDICALSVFESKLRGIDENKTFIGRIVKPVYNLQNIHYYIVAISLWFITTYRLQSEYDFEQIKLVWKMTMTYVMKAKQWWNPNRR